VTLPFIIFRKISKFMTDIIKPDSIESGLYSGVALTFSGFAAWMMGKLLVLLCPAELPGHVAIDTLQKAKNDPGCIIVYYGL
jgi:hypothetical protein